MRVAAGIMLCVVALTGAFALGRATADGSDAASVPSPGAHEFVGRIGDTVKIPSIALYCAVDVEARRSRFHCGRLAPDPRYDVSFERTRTVVGRVGDPSQITVFPEP